MLRRIFISHKVKDKEAVKAIKDALEIRGGNALEIFVSERIKSGVKWAEEIWGNLKKADWLLLVYTDPSEEWNWCLFEAGFFAGCTQNEKGRLVCLHTLDVEPPMPVQGWQTVSVTDPTQLENFLKELFAGISQVLIDSPEEIRRLADSIAGAFTKKVRRKIKSDWHTQYVTLSMNAVQLEEFARTGRIPAQAQCGLKEGESLYVFGHGNEECTMSTLEQGLYELYKRMWLKSFADALLAASHNRRPIPKILPLYSPSSGKDYHVILQCVDRFSDGSSEFYLLLIEKIPENEHEQGRQLRSIGNMLKLGRSFRWKILTKFHRELTVLNRKTNAENAIRDCMVRLGWAMDWVIGESQRLDILTPDDIVDVFKDKEVKKILSHSIETVWPGLFTSIRTGIETEDIQKVLAVLKEMLNENKTYMVFAAGRYQELLKEMP